MSNEAQSSLELGKQLFDKEKYDEAVSAFAKAVRLVPDNAEYRVWFSRALRMDNELEKAVDEASKALELDAKLSSAYRARANAKADLKKYDEALRDISQAIELNPEDPDHFRTRRSIYYDTGDWQNYICDNMRYNDLKGEIDLYNPENAKDNDVKFRLESINKHFTSLVYPQIKSNGEKIVDYWEGLIIWGRESRQVMYAGSTYTHEHGTIGHGYICLTNQNLRIVSLQELTQKLDKGLKESKRGFGRFLVDALSRSSDDTKASTKDEYWTIPNGTVQGAQSFTDSLVGQPSVSIVTAVLTWYIYTVDLPMISTAINMAATGKLSEVFSVSVHPPKTTQAEVIGLLKELGELKEKGIITESEFNEKKKELLSRL